MSSSPPIVPSKNALKALRRLAFQSSTVIGAVGSLCGAVALSYDAHQRVKFAEQILDTKRTIRSVSNGNGPAHVQRMFEAAEKGEDFGLDPAKSGQRRRKRNVSAVMVETSVDDLDGGSGLEDSWRPLMVESLDGSTGTPGGDRNSWGNLWTIPSLETLPQRSGPRGQDKTRKQETPLVRSKTVECVAHTVSRESERRVRESVSGVRQISYDRERSAYICQPRGAIQLLAASSYGQILQLQSERPYQRCYPFSSNAPDEPIQQSRIQNVPGKEAGIDRTFVRAINSPAANKIIAASQQQHKLGTNVVYGHPEKPKSPHNKIDSGVSQSKTKESHEVSPAEMIIAATQQQHKLASHTVYGRPRAPKASSKAVLAENVDLWLRPHRNRSDRQQVRVMSTKVQKPKPNTRETPQLQPNSHSEQAASRSATAIYDANEDQPYSLPTGRRALSKIPAISGQRNTPPAPRTLELLEPGFRDWPLPDAKWDVRNQLSSKDDSREIRTPRDNAEADTGRIFSNADDINVQEPDTPQDPFLTAALNTLPTAGTAHSDPQDEAFEKPETKQHDLMSTKGYTKVHDAINALLASNRRAEAGQLWLDTLTAYATPEVAFDMELLEAMRLAFHREFPWHVTPYPLRKMVRHLLTNKKRHPRAAALLFPIRPETQESGGFGGVSPKEVFTTAVYYLTEIWQQDHNVKELALHLQKVTIAARHCGVRLAEALFVPVLRLLCSVSEMSQAQTIYNGMLSSHHVVPTFYSRAVMVRGYAAAGDWDRVAKEIESMHAVGLSRKRPQGYSLLFNAVLREHIFQNPVTQAYDYLVHAIGYWGLIPTSAISTTIIQACLANRRFDMVREWVETVRMLFPQVDVAKSADFAWQTAETWKQINASCEEIEQSCNALAYASNGDIFRPVFTEVVRDSLAADLARKLHQADKAKTSEFFSEGDDLNDMEDLDHYIKQGFALLSSAETNGIIREDFPHDIIQQTKSISRLNELFSDAEAQTLLPRRSQTTSDHKRSSENFPRVPTSKYTSLYLTFPDPLMQQILPSYETIKSLILGYYATRVKQELPVKSTILEYVCEKLKRRGRQLDVVRLLNEIYAWPQTQNPLQQEPIPPPVKSNGIFVDIIMLSIWLRCAFEMKSLTQVQNVFRAALDDSRDIRLSLPFITLARMSALKVTNNRRFRASERERAEMNLLLIMLKQKYRNQQRKLGNTEWEEKNRAIVNNADTVNNVDEELEAYAWSEDEDADEEVSMAIAASA